MSFPEQEKIKDGVSLYAKLGITKYISFDLFDSRAEKVDLNLDLKRTDKWDIVTNFGTSEHVFNQQAIFKNCHDLTKTGGISLHCLPVSSGMDHGFFNYHPTFFRSLAIANNYSILDFRYIPFINLQQRSKRRNYNFVDLSKYRELKSGARTLRISKDIFISKAKLILRFSNWDKLIKPIRFYDEFFQGDMVFVAFRKNSDVEFANPSQY